MRRAASKKIICGLLAFCLLWVGGIQAAARTTYNCSAGIHQYNVTIVKAATEHQDGQRKYTCTLCGHSYTEAIPMYGHLYGGWAVAREATCISNGLRYRLCTKNTHKYHRQEESIPKLGHSYQRTTTSPTCTQGGVVTYRCIRCNDSYQKTLPAGNHEYEKNVVPATCAADGQEIFTCVYCNNQYTNKIPKTAHSYESEIVEPACTQPGKKVFTCTKCGDTNEEVLPAGSHDYASTVTPPQCTVAGKTRYTCTLCGDFYEEETPALGHDFGEWETGRVATVDEPGLEYRVCAQDAAHREERELPQLVRAYNTADVVLGGANASAVLLFLGLIGYDIPVLLWARRRRKEYLQVREGAN